MTLEHMTIDPVVPDAQLKLSTPGLPDIRISLRLAGLIQNQLAAAISAIILPTAAFRWEEPTQAFKASAVLLCEDQRYVTCFSDAPINHPLLTVAVSPQSRIAGWVAQQQESGQTIPEGQYMACSAPSFVVIGFPDFEDAQASVAARLRAQGIS